MLFKKNFPTDSDEFYFENYPDSLTIKIKKDPHQTKKDEVFMLMLNTDKKLAREELKVKNLNWTR